MTELDQAIRARLDATTEHAYPEMQAMRDALLAVLDIHPPHPRDRHECFKCVDARRIQRRIAEKLGVEHD